MAPHAHLSRRLLGIGSAVLGLAVAVFLAGSESAGAPASQVQLLRVPGGGLQPQAVVDARGALHLLYFTGKPAEGDLVYVRREPGAAGFSAPLRVNSQPGSAVAAGTIRGGHLAVSKDGRVHVAWNGSHRAAGKAGSHASHPMLYARLNDAGTAFEPQRNLMQATEVLDGGGSVAADGAGNVYVVWHALARGSTRGEEHRKVWVARSTDGGKTFARETPVPGDPTGACGCCGLRAFVDRRGTLYVLYRSASDKTHRDMFLLASSDQGKTFQSRRLHEWEIGTCPMSSEAFAEGPEAILAAWETAGQVYFSRVKPGSCDAAAAQAAPGPRQQRKHPALAVNARGEMILVWTEGTGWQKGGALAWQVYDRHGQPTSEAGRLDGGIPTWSFASVHALPDGSFQIFH